MKERRKRTIDEPIETTLVQVASLYYEEHLSQQEIASRLKVSRSLIAYYLQQARDTGIVRIQIIKPESTCRQLVASLKRATGVKHICVTPNPRGSSTLSLRAVAGAAARFVADQLDDGDILGLAWGRTTTAVVELLGPTRARQISVLPLMGESSHAGLHSQMNRLVMQAAQRLRAKAYFLSLPMVLSSPSLRDALLKEAGVADVVDRWNKTNVGCVGVGVVPPVPGMIVYIGEEHLPRLVRAGAVGDVCGIYYDRDGRIIPSGLEDRMIAAGFEQLRAIPCLVAVACGEEKAAAVLGALRTGLISALFIDQEMAEQILVLLGVHLEHGKTWDGPSPKNDISLRSGSGKRRSTRSL